MTIPSKAHLCEVALETPITVSTSFEVAPKGKNKEKF